MSLIYSIYKSSKKDEMYLYVEKAKGLARVPESLLQMFGEPQLVMTLLMTPERQLARIDRDEVEKWVQQQGFYLQMPPGKQAYKLGEPS